MSETMKYILVVEEIGSKGLKIVYMRMQKTTYNFIYVSSYIEAIDISSTFKPDIFLIDYELHRMNAIFLYNKLRMMPGISDVPAILTGIDFLCPGINQECMKRQIVPLEKPFDWDRLLGIIDQLTGGEKGKWDSENRAEMKLGLSDRIG